MVGDYQITLTVRADSEAAVYQMFEKQINDYRVESFQIVPPQPEPDPRTKLHLKRQEYLHKVCSPAPFIPHPHYLSKNRAKTGH